MDKASKGQSNGVEFYEIPKKGYSLLNKIAASHSSSGIPTKSYVQLEYIEDYIRRADLVPSDVRSFAIENHYIDRDYMADYGVFFASLLYPPPNHCQRLHFFAAEPKFVEEKLLELGNLLSQSNESYQKECIAFSKKYYLGFSVIRPLPGSPVGRTVLRLLPSQKGDGARRFLNCTRNYDVNFMGVMLEVQGLAFQQQDLAVSRCATIAIWSALNITSVQENTTIPTPAEITRHASRTQLPFGRQMPSEGLNCSQMCFALQSVGAPPFLLRATNFVEARQSIYACINSGMPCVLLIHKGGDRRLYHAVTVAGMKLTAKHTPCLDTGGSMDDLSADVTALYIHDDRIGPYRRAELIRKKNNEFWLSIGTKSHREDEEPEEWCVDQIIIPSHSKIRISFHELETIARKSIIPSLQSAIAVVNKIEERTTGKAGFWKMFEGKKAAPAISFQTWIERGHKYTRRILTENLLTDSIAFRKDSVLPRYLAVMRFAGDSFGKIDILVDTTTPKPSYKWIGVVALRKDDKQGEMRHLMANQIASELECKHWQ